MPTDDSLRFECPHCQQNLSAPPELYGQSLDCPACTKPFVVPRPAVAVPIPVPDAYSVPAPVPMPEAPPTGPALWNPSVAAVWSLFLTPAFGSYLLRENAKTLGRAHEADHCTGWFWISLLFSAAGIFMVATTGDNPLTYWSFALFFVWVFALAWGQEKFVKATYGDNYVKKPWRKPLLAGAGFVIGIMLLSGWIISGEGGTRAHAASSGDSDTSTDPSVEESAPTNSDVADAVARAIAAKQEVSRNAVGANTPAPATVSLESIFSKSGDDGLEEARKFMAGIWTCTESDAPFLVWHKLDVKPDGSLLLYRAKPTDDDWGQPKTLTWTIVTDKFSNTGKRFYQLKLLDDKDPNAYRYFFILIHREVVSLRFGDESVTIKRGDAFPFSK